MTRSLELQFKEKLVNPDFVCCGKVYLYYRFNKDKTVLYVQGTQKRYLQDRLFGISVDGFVSNVKKALL